jgi:hypothetical protein
VDEIRENMVRGIKEKSRTLETVNTEKPASSGTKKEVTGTIRPHITFNQPSAPKPKTMDQAEMPGSSTNTFILKDNIASCTFTRLLKEC